MSESIDKKESQEVSSSTKIAISSETAKGHFDVAAGYLDQYESIHGNYTEIEAKSVLRKIDLRITPLMWVTTILAAVDVSNMITVK
jgi:hypothetical protein